MSQRDIALALSGGGYRAAYFALGVLRQLHELDLLSRVAVISSVSGGSIVAAAYAQALVDGEEFDHFLQKTCRFLETRTLDVPAILRAIAPWRSSSRNLERAFGELYRGEQGRLTTMRDLQTLDGPRFLFNATAVHNGHGWRFISGGTVEEWELGETHDAAYAVKVDRYAYDATLAKAVTASAAFPAFSAVTIRRNELEDIDEVGIGESRHFYQELPDPVRLSDGGVRDNTGLTSILGGHPPQGFEHDYYLIGSDAGSVISHLTKPPSGRLRKFKYLMRQFEIRGHHNNGLIGAFILREHRRRRASKKGMAMLRIHEPAVVAAESAESVGSLSRVSTRLKSPGWNVGQQLMNHGADVLWARLSEYTDLLSSVEKMPHAHSRAHKDEDSDLNHTGHGDNPYDEVKRFVGQVLTAMQQEENIETISDAALHVSADEANPPLSAAAGRLLFDLAGIAPVYRMSAVRRLADRGYSARTVSSILHLALAWSVTPGLAMEPFDEAKTCEWAETSLRESLGPFVGTVIRIDELSADQNDGQRCIEMKYTIVETGEQAAMASQLPWGDL